MTASAWRCLYTSQACHTCDMPFDWLGQATEERVVRHMFLFAIIREPSYAKLSYTSSMADDVALAFSCFMSTLGLCLTAVAKL